MSSNVVHVNRAPVLTLWAAIVAERLGYGHASALSLGKAVAGLNAQSKGRRLGIYGPPARKPARPAARPAARRPTVELMGRAVPVRGSGAGLRAVAGGAAIDPVSVERYLHARFGPQYDAAARALRALAGRVTPRALARSAYELYVDFRPAVPEGRAGWGARGVLDLGKVGRLGARR
jgi:hypothetical protein